ncbi:MAG: 4Fe-4S binding protein [Promethearchaeia archaeon]
MTDIQEKKDYQKILASIQRPIKGEAGQTGSWSKLKPVIDAEKCTPSKSGKMVCFTCWLYCPEGMISRTIPPKVDIKYCKGCGICAEECPVEAITMQEVEEK